MEPEIEPGVLGRQALLKHHLGLALLPGRATVDEDYVYQAEFKVQYKKVWLDK